ncbi:hypothetical protein BGZ76_007057, partial [Entomortierella beljakovae]
MSNPTSPANFDTSASANQQSKDYEEVVETLKTTSFTNPSDNGDHTMVIDPPSDGPIISNEHRFNPMGFYGQSPIAPKQQPAIDQPLAVTPMIEVWSNQILAMENVRATEMDPTRIDTLTK